MAVMQPQTKEFWWPGEAGKDREQILFWSFQREHITHTSNLVQWHWFKTYVPHNFKQIH